MDTLNRRASIAIGVIAVLVAAVLLIDHALGPIGIETSGVVTAVSSTTDEYGHPWTQLSVKLQDGSTVEAKASPGCVIFTGQVARLRGFRSMYSASRTYLFMSVKEENET
jgi:hypothetical protein